MAAEALIVEDAYQRGYADAIADMRKNNKDIAAKSACRTPQALILYAERQEI